MLPLLPILTGIGSAMRLPALAAFLGGLGAQVFGFLALRFTRQVAINLTVIAMVLGLALVVAISIQTLLVGLSYVVPRELNQAFSFFIPNNAIPCLSAIFSARVIRWVWEWQVYVVTKVTG